MSDNLKDYRKGVKIGSFGNLSLIFSLSMFFLAVLLIPVLSFFPDYFSCLVISILIYLGLLGLMLFLIGCVAGMYYFDK